jgi:imidazolonepropionase-like amidohydrolase
MTRSVLTLALVAGLAFSAAANPFVPGKPQDHPIALVNATLHPVDGPEIAGGMLLFNEGKIVAVGRDIALPEGTEKIDVQGKHVYPGLIQAYSNLGLSEIRAVRASNDVTETGRMNPNVKAQVAFNPDSEHIPVTRSNGVLLALVAPQGGLISGMAAVMQLDGWTYEDMCLQSEAGQILNWPRYVPLRGFRDEPPPQAQIERRARDLAELDEAFRHARAYLAAKNSQGKPGVPPLKYDARWEGMIPVLQRRAPLIINADESNQIQASVAFAARENVRLVISGGYDAGSCTELLKKHAVGVILSGVNRLPLRRDDDYDAAFTLPHRLLQAGVKFCISSATEGHGNERNLPYHAAAAAAHGLPRDEALKAITLGAAEILGIDQRVGSLTAGKDATLFVADGDILEIATRVEMAFVQGRRVDLADKQKLLYEKYQEKHRRLRGG